MLHRYLLTEVDRLLWIPSCTSGAEQIWRRIEAVVLSTCTHVDHRLTNQSLVDVVAMVKQSLLQRTSSAAVYMLLGALPLEAELHKRRLSLLNSVITSDNECLRGLI